MTREHYLFVTGRLAEASLRPLAQSLAQSAGFDYSIQVMPITVAALKTPKWIARRLNVPWGVTRVILPGYCDGDLTALGQAAGVPVVLGPRDLRQLPEFFGRQPDLSDYGPYDIEILAEINHAPRLPLRKILKLAGSLEGQGADVIDLGCDPGPAWPGVGQVVKALRDEGRRVSIDSFNPAEIELAVAAGAELVLSVNGSNLRYAAGWGCEVVVVPDAANTVAAADPVDAADALGGLETSIASLSEAGVEFRIDPILSPIAFGMSASLGRYLDVRRRWPQAEMLMGIGNLTELTEVDSAGINVLLLGFCQEQGIRSVLTTQEINWTRSCVRECDLARRLVRYAVSRHVLPKHLEHGVLMLRSEKLLEHGRQALDELAAAIRDHSYRVFAEDGRLHLIAAGLHLEGQDPFDLFEQLLPRAAAPLDASHAFYLGYEMAKAATALTLGKNYRQDEALDWGLLTVPELTRRQRRALRLSRGRADDCP
jgi:dihydropteroate synthase-like protein